MVGESAPSPPKGALEAIDAAAAVAAARLEPLTAASQREGFARRADAAPAALTRLACARPKPRDSAA
jgi:hypothetical protein